MQVVEYKKQLITIEKVKDGSLLIKTNLNGIEPFKMKFYQFSKKVALQRFKIALDTELTFFNYFQNNY